MFSIPSKEEWYARINEIQQHDTSGSYPIRESYFEFLEWLHHANITLTKYEKLKKKWEEQLHEYLQAHPHLRQVSLSRKDPMEKNIDEINQKTAFLPSLNFTWSHALIVTSRKQRVKDYERAIKLLEDGLHELSGKKKQLPEALPDAHLLQVKNYSVICPRCRQTLVSGEYGFLLQEDWDDVENELFCTSCNETYKKPKNPWIHGIHNYPVEK